MRELTSENSESQKPPRLRYLRHNPEPDYTKPLLKIPSEALERMMGRLRFLYGEIEAEAYKHELERILKVYYAHKTQEMIEAEKDFDPTERFTEKDLVLITYGDLLRSEDRSPLATLAGFLETRPRFRGVFNTLHILPFFPYSSDRGFSITDFRTVNPKLGTWQDIEDMGVYYQLMFDGVLNHASSKSRAFQEMLNGNPDFKDFAIVYRSPDELTPEQRRIIVRPRTSDILTKFYSIEGPIWVWTTFSPDQIDLNYNNPKVLLRAIETLLLYVRRGADIIRLDAVTYLWDEPGTPSVHLEQTHEIIKLFRDVLGVVAPGVALITETNVPHEENISYFGNGQDEAQMVYNFALPPLVLYTFYRQDATALSRWAADLGYPSNTSTYFNMLDTHDGVGLMGAKNILPRKDIDFIIKKASEHGAFITYRTGEDGQHEPYEINTTWFSALNRGDGGKELALQVKRFVASRSISLALRGVPGIYFHGLIGTRNDPEVVKVTGSKREINRQVIQEGVLLKELEDPNSRLSHTVDELGKILRIRVRHRAFHPNGDQKILMISPNVFTALRTSPEGDEQILTLTNVTDRPCKVNVPLSGPISQEMRWHDLISERVLNVENRQLRTPLEPYDVAWLVPQK